LTPEEPKPELKLKNPVGRPKLPRYDDMQPVFELYIRIRNRARKTKIIQPAEVKAWLVEIAMLQALGHEIRIQEPETPTVEKVLEQFNKPIQKPQVVEQGPTEVSLLPGDL